MLLRRIIPEKRQPLGLLLIITRGGHQSEYRWFSRIGQKKKERSQIQTSREAAISLPKLEAYIQLIREKLTTLDFDMKRLALDMLNIKVWLEGQSVEITGTIPVEDADVVTKSS